MKKTLFFASMAVAALFASCTNDENPADSIQHLRVDAEVNEAIQGRAIKIGTTFANGDKIGVSLYESGNTTYDGNTWNNAEYTFDGAKWNPTAAPGLSSTEGSAIAYYPYTSSVTDLTAIAITATGYTGTDSQTDWMYCESEVTGLKNSNPTADFSMKHAGSIIQINLTKDETFDATATLSKVSIKSEAFGTSATMNANGGALSEINNANSPEIAASGLSATITTTATQISLIVLPDKTAQNKDVYVTATINNATYTAKVSLASIEQGKRYEFPINLTATGLAVGSVSLYDWADGTTGSSGTTNLEPGA